MEILLLLVLLILEALWTRFHMESSSSLGSSRVSQQNLVNNPGRCILTPTTCGYYRRLADGYVREPCVFCS